MSEPAIRRGRPPGATRDQLLGTARRVFLANGFAGARMEDVATLARISKASLYREYASKSALFAAVVAHWSDSGRDAMRPSLEVLMAGVDVERELLAFASTLQRAVLGAEVVAMRRLVAAESDSHPQVAARYLAESWDRNLRDLAGAFEQLDARGELAVPDPAAAAEEFVWLVVGAPLNAATLGGKVGPQSVGSGVAVFLARYRAGDDG